jgi:hypothetical protein
MDRARGASIPGSAVLVPILLLPCRARTPRRSTAPLSTCGITCLRRLSIPTRCVHSCQSPTRSANLLLTLTGFTAQYIKGVHSVEILGKEGGVTHRKCVPTAASGIIALLATWSVQLLRSPAFLQPVCRRSHAVCCLSTQNGARHDAADRGEDREPADNAVHRPAIWPRYLHARQ